MVKSRAYNRAVKCSKFSLTKNLIVLQRMGVQLLNMRSELMAGCRRKYKYFIKNTNPG